MNEKELAEKIIDSLFTAYGNEKAVRLVIEMTPGTLNGPGWGRKPAEDLVEDIIRKYLDKETL
jgi:hypothetical protein